MIQIEDIHKTYRMGDQEVRALNGVTLTISPGEFVAIMGPSGSGKSTLMHMLGLLDVPSSGSYRLLGKEVSTLTEDELAISRRETIGFVFQQFNLLPRTPALENVALPQLYSRSHMELAKAEFHLKQVGLGSRIHHKPNELSGGQQQRVAIARALINDPKIVLADEPTGNLDSKSEGEIMGVLQSLNDQGITIIIVTHEEEIAQYAKRVIRMRDGRVQSDERLDRPKRGAPTPQEVRAAPVPANTAEGQASPAPRRSRTREYLVHFTEGIKALRANKIRSGLSMLGILIGVAAVIAMLAVGTGAQLAIEEQLSSLGSNLLVLRPGAIRVGGVALDAGSVTRLSLDDAEAIQQTFSEIHLVAPAVSGRVQVTYADKNWSTRVLATIPEYAQMRALVPVIGRFFDTEENRRRTRVVVLGMTVVTQLFGDADPIGEFVKINKVPFQVIGILPEKGSNAFQDQDDTLAVPLVTGMRRLLGKDYVDEIDIEVGKAQDIELVQAKVKELMIRRHRVPPSQQDPFQVRNMADVQEALSQTSRTMGSLLAAIAAISLLVGGIGIMNIMLVSVTERTREIGLRKAIGARRRDILSQFLIEAIVVSLTGGVLGVLLGVGITLLLSALAHWTTSISLKSVLLATFFSATIGVVFGIWPARKASHLSPIEALRYE